MVQTQYGRAVGSAVVAFSLYLARMRYTVHKKRAARLQPCLKSN